MQKMNFRIVRKCLLNLVFILFLFVVLGFFAGIVFNSLIISGAIDTNQYYNDYVDRFTKIYVNIHGYIMVSILLSIVTIMLIKINRREDLNDYNDVLGHHP